ncbi:hypothetical protein I350_03245 [Cryptococcus amylolentus CBS 6273]|uniref:Uncharacterized protein n=1 Tax=Cryptococcus amylolentus CBS 6273 TaxID=1296118 RepID=A0A1E3K3G5_9TREE|nr:hypothetical protein I350_03245 [Cryptococcus amylolentus CBS 6273]
MMVSMDLNQSTLRDMQEGALEDVTEQQLEETRAGNASARKFYYQEGWANLSPNFQRLVGSWSESLEALRSAEWIKVVYIGIFAFIICFASHDQSVCTTEDGPTNFGRDSEGLVDAGSRPDFKLKSEYDVVDLTVRNERGRLASWALHSGHLDVPDEYREDVDTSETEYIESVAQLYNGGFPALHPADTPESRHTRSIIISRDFNQEAAHELEYGEPTEQSGDFLDKVVEYSRRIRTAYDEEDWSGFSREFCRLTQEWNRTVEDLWDLGIVDVPHPLPVEESSSEEEGSAMEE